MRESITDKVKSLHLPDNEFVVTGSSSMAILGLLESADDIDLAVSQQVFDILDRDGWEQRAGMGGKPLMSRDIFDVGVGLDPWSVEELLEDAFMVENVPFMSLRKLLEWKRMAARPKDDAHIAIIEKYLDDQPVAKPTEVR